MKRRILFVFCNVFFKTKKGLFLYYDDNEKVKERLLVSNPVLIVLIALFSLLLLAVIFLFLISYELYAFAFFFLLLVPVLLGVFLYKESKKKKKMPIRYSLLSALNYRILWLPIFFFLLFITCFVLIMSGFVQHEVFIMIIIYACLAILIMDIQPSYIVAKFSTAWILSKEFRAGRAYKIIIIDNEGLKVGKNPYLPWNKIHKIYKVGQLFILKTFGNEMFHCFIDRRLMGLFLDLARNNNVKLFNFQRQYNKLYSVNTLSLSFFFFIISFTFTMVLLLMENYLGAVKMSLYTYYLTVGIAVIMILLIASSWSIFKVYEMYISPEAYIVLKLFNRVIKVFRPVAGVNPGFYKNCLDKNLAESYWLHTLDDKYRVDIRAYKRNQLFNFLIGIYLGFQLWVQFLFSFLDKHDAERKMRYLKEEGKWK